MIMTGVEACTENLCYGEIAIPPGRQSFQSSLDGIGFLSMTKIL